MSAGDIDALEIIIRTGLSANDKTGLNALEQLVSIAAQPEGFVLPTPIGFARKQDLLEYKPVVVLYDKEPAPENGYPAVKLYSEDQINFMLSARPK